MSVACSFILSPPTATAIRTQLLFKEAKPRRSTGALVAVMSDSLGSWIAKLVVLHDIKYGADFGRVVTVNRCCQLIDVSALEVTGLRVLRVKRV